MYSYGVIVNIIPKQFVILSEYVSERVKLEVYRGKTPRQRPVIKGEMKIKENHQY